MGKAEENKQKKRNSLLSQAYALFTANGISNTTIADIASHAGVAKGTFYSYFKDKDDLIDRLIAQKAETLLLKAIDSLKQREKVEALGGVILTVEEKIILLCDHLISELNNDPHLLKFLNKRLNLGFYMKAYTRDNFIGNLDIKQMYLDLITSDGSRWSDPELMLYCIVEFTSSTIHSVIIDSQPVDLETYKPHLFRCLRSIMASYKIETE